MEHVYCEHCQVVAVNLGDKYCVVCLEAILDYLFDVYALAEEHVERIAIEKGLY
jgi:hypothetical protein